MIVEELENTEVDSEDEMSELLSEQFTSFLENIWDTEGMTREPEETDGGDIPEGGRLYTDKAMPIIKAEEKRLWNIGQKYFPGGDTPVESYMYQEY